MSGDLIAILAAVGGGAVVVFGLVAMIARFYRKVDQGRPLVINGMRGDPEAPSAAASSGRSSTAPRRWTSRSRRSRSTAARAKA